MTGYVDIYIWEKTITQCKSNILCDGIYEDLDIHYKKQNKIKKGFSGRTNFGHVAVKINNDQYQSFCNDEGCDLSCQSKLDCDLSPNIGSAVITANNFSESYEEDQKVFQAPATYHYHITCLDTKKMIKEFNDIKKNANYDALKSNCVWAVDRILYKGGFIINDEDLKNVSMIAEYYDPVKLQLVLSERLDRNGVNEKISARNAVFGVACGIMGGIEFLGGLVSGAIGIAVGQELQKN